MKKLIVVSLCLAALWGGAFEAFSAGGADELYRQGLEAYMAQDYGRAFECFSSAAEEGYVYAQHDLGVMYYKGEGVEQDYARAAELYSKATEQGYMYAQSSLALMYYDGEGVDQDYTQAAELFRKAADAGNNEAQIRLGGASKSLSIKKTTVQLETGKK